MPSIRNVAFNRGPVRFEVDGIRVQLLLGEHTAEEWMAALTGPDLNTGVLTLLDPVSVERTLDALGDGSFRASRFTRLVRSAVTEATGRPWWESIRLAGSVVQGDGRVLGNLCLRGVDPSRMDIATYLCAVWAFLSHNADDQALFKLESQLKMLPPEAEDEDYDLFDEGDDFGETVRQLQNAPGVSLG